MKKNVLVAVLLTLLSHTLAIATIVVVGLVFGSGCASQTRTPDGRMADVRHTPRRGPDILVPEESSPAEEHTPPLCQGQLTTSRVSREVAFQRLEECFRGHAANEVLESICTGHGGRWEEGKRCECTEGYRHPTVTAQTPLWLALNSCVTTEPLPRTRFTAVSRKR